MGGGLSERKEKEDWGEGLSLRLEGYEQWSAARSRLTIIYLTKHLGSYVMLD